MGCLNNNGGDFPSKHGGGSGERGDGVVNRDFQLFESPYKFSQLFLITV